MCRNPHLVRDVIEDRDQFFQMPRGKDRGKHLALSAVHVALVPVGLVARACVAGRCMMSYL